MNRNDFQELARLRLEEAKVLRDNGKFAGAYYLAGYSIECALKACIAKRTRSEEFPPKPKVVNKYYTHDLASLMVAAELKPKLDARSQNDKDFENSWSIVEQWNEDSRYDTDSEHKARELIEATENQAYGILPWLQNFW